MIDAPIRSVDAAVYTVPTDAPEADGTLSWDATAMVLVQAHAGDTVGTGWTYGPTACAAVITDTLAGIVTGRDALDVGGAFSAMVNPVRNAGRPGAVGYAISAVDVALWDLKARLLALPLPCPCPCTGCSAPCATRCRSTAAAGSPRTTSASSATS
jgi:L-alanine-DL-glutamate epimerase-like enolase superfamily enzyme